MINLAWIYIIILATIFCLVVAIIAGYKIRHVIRQRRSGREGSLASSIAYHETRAQGA
jgi:hypothetical protein